MSVRLLERNVQCPGCHFSKLKLHVCRKCMVVIFSTVLNRTARCCNCGAWLGTEKEVKVRGTEGFAEWYVVSRRPELDFICGNFTKHKRNILAALAMKQQLTLTGFGKENTR